MEKISWLDKVTNEEVLRRVNEDRQILNSIWQRKHRWIGHVLRHDGLLHEFYAFLAVLGIIWEKGITLQFFIF